MAKIVEEIVAIKFSRLIRDTDSEDSTEIVDSKLIDLIDQVLQETLEMSDGVVVEVEKIP